MDRALVETLTKWRRHLHAHPELSRREAATARFVQRQLRELGVPFTAADVGGHGIVATLSRGNVDRSVGLRADMDALPITETTGLPYASANAGVMHACGHDGHTVSLLGAVGLLLQDTSWLGTIHCVFQPAEEDLSGARAMIADGLFERFPMERIFAFHNWPGLEAGTVAVHDGPVMSQGGSIELTIIGQAGHAAKPHMTRDPIVAAGHLITALQTVVSRNVDPTEPTVVTIGAISGGTVPNQIPDKVTMLGTVRSFRQRQREEVLADIRRIADGIGATFGVRVEMAEAPGTRVTSNTKAECALAVAAAVAAGLPVRRDLPPSTGGEDFSFLLAHRPGAFVWIGNGPADGGRELHSPCYDFNDAILPAAANWLAFVAKCAVTAAPGRCAAP